MATPPLAVLGVGLVSGVGLNAEQSCAAIRCGINNFQETRFIGRDGEWLVGSAVELKQPWRGITKLAKMASRAIAECFEAGADGKPEETPVLACLAEPERPGRPQGLGPVILQDIERELGLRLHPHSRVIELGRVGAVVALLQARRMLAEARCSHVIVAAADSFLGAATLAAYNSDDRLLTKSNPNGLIPGEAAGAVLLSGDEDMPARLLVRGLGFGREPAPFGSGRPSRADGLVRAARGALGEAGLALKDCDLRIADMNGEQHRFKEAALAVTRLLRDRKPLFPLWHLADCTGEVGAATLPAMLALLFTGASKDFLPGQTVLGHLGNDDDRRAAFVAQATSAQTLSWEMAAEAAYRVKRRSAA